MTSLAPSTDLDRSPSSDFSASRVPARQDVVVCSFFTDDSYYRGHASRLREVLGRLGLAHEMEEIHKPAGADWADMTRRKIGFLAEVCERNPRKKVFWIDVDCSLLSLPDYVADFTADIIGFQRGFSSPLTIGYGQRTRFWEPCFFGINTTESARKFMRDALEAERSMTEIKATDDYFFEESWRANGARMTFQIIPSVSVLSKADPTSGVVPFFTFGASGNVSEFKHKVQQHQAVGRSTGQPGAPAADPLHKALRVAKRVERSLPTAVRGPARRIADQMGVTHVLTRAGAVGQGSTHLQPRRARLARHMIAASQRGEGPAVHEAYAKLTADALPTPSERAAKQAADAFLHYATVDRDRPEIPLSWWSRPFPGNFGDWLSPLLVSSTAARSVRYVPPTAPGAPTHLVGVGSIGRFIKPTSIVFGTGVSSTDLQLEPRARYLSVRGPVTAQLLRDSGGPDVQVFGDPGVLLSRIFPMERSSTNGRTALVRHFKHAHVPLILPEDIDELSVKISLPGDIEAFLQTLNAYDSVVTSAMHVMIACHSYGIPCALISFQGLEDAVHGTGVKYEDYSRGADLARVYTPSVVGLDLTKYDLDDLMAVERVSVGVMDRVECSLRQAINLVHNDD